MSGRKVSLRSGSLAIAMLGAAVSMTVVFVEAARAQSFGGNGGGANSVGIGGTGGGYQQSGGNGASGNNGGGGGGPGVAGTLGGAPGNADSGGGGTGGANGLTAAAVPVGSFVGGNGGNATAAANAVTVAGGGGGAGGYGLALTTPGPHTTSAGQIFTGGSGGNANGTSAAGVAGSGGGGIILLQGGTFTNAQGASAIGGAAGTTPSVSNCFISSQRCAVGGDGLTTSNYTGASFAATVINAGLLAGGAGSAIVATPGATPGSTSNLANMGGAGVGFVGGGSLSNTATGIITGGIGGAGFGGTATSGPGPAGPGGAGINLTGGGLVNNDGQIAGGVGAAGTLGNPGARAAGLGQVSFEGGAGGIGIAVSALNGSVVNNGTGVIKGGVGGDGGGGLLNTFNPMPKAGGGGAGGAAISLSTGSVLNFGQLTGGAAGKGADATAAGEVGGGSSISSGGNGITMFSGTAVDNRGTVTGGTGAAAGASGAGAAGGNGGNGGNGVFAINGGDIVNSGLIQGGNGGAASLGNGGANGTPGAGGAGIFMNGPGTITTGGTIVGGLNADGTRANAIFLGPGDQTLTLKTGASFVGDVVVRPFTQGQRTLNLDGGSTGTISLSQFQGFNLLSQTGGSGGVWTLTGTSSFNNAAFISAGTMVLDPASFLSTGILAVNTGGTLSVSAQSFPNGALDVRGGTFRVTGTSLHSLNGFIFWEGGAIDIADAANTFTAGLGLGFSGSLAGLTKLGAGTLVLASNSAYTGATIVDAGTLIVNGSISLSAVTVNPGATLGGNGTVGSTTINGGTLSPGNSIGLLTVNGSLVFTAAASYMVEVSPANADRTNVTGTATLGGATVNASFAAGSYVAKQYTIVNATGGISGTFNSVVNTNVPNNFTSSLSYDANNAYLNLALSFIPPPNMGLNANQQNVANAIVGFFNSNGGIPLAFGSLTAAGLTQVSGEVATGSQQTTFDAMGLFMGLLTDPFIAGRGDPVTSSAGASQFADENDTASAYAANGKARSKSERDAYAAVYRKAPMMADPFTQRWSVWAAGYGGSQTTDGNAVLGSNNTRSSIGGVAVGADYRFSPYTIAGFALAGGATNFSVNGLGSGRSDLFQAGAFVRHNVGAAYLTGALAYGWQDITTDRTVAIAGTDLLRAQFNANAFSGRVEGGYRFVAPWMGVGITPYAAGQFTTFDLPAYAEQAIAGANTFALSYASKSVTDSRSEFGLRSDKSFALQNGIFTLRGRAAWAHDFNPDRSITPTFQTLPGASFVVNGAAQASDSALVTASAEMKWLSGFSLAGTFEGEFSNVTRSYAGKGVARYSW